MTQSVVRREGLIRRRFVRDYLWPNRPAVVTGALNDWVGLTKWNTAFFQSKLGHEPVCLQGDTFNSTRTIPFAEYLEAVATYEELPASAPHVAFNLESRLQRIAADGGTRSGESIAGQQGVPLDWSPNGRHLLFAQGDEATSGDLFLLTAGAASDVEPWLNDEFYESEAAISPTGDWVAYVSNQTNTHEVYIRPLFDTGAAPVRVSSSGGREPRWAADGSELFFRAEDELFVSQIESEPSQLRAGRPGRLFRNRALAFQPHPTSTTAYNVSPDGRFLMVEDATAMY